MALKSWSIAEFPSATPEIPVSIELFDSSINTIIMLSLIASNNSAEDSATFWFIRKSWDDVVKATWKLTLVSGNSPFALDSKIVYTAGDKFFVTCDNPEACVEASGDES